MLDIMHESIEDKTRLHTSKRVVSVLQTKQEAVIISEDGSEIGCDFVAGADGVRSIVRSEIAKTAATDKNLEWRRSSLAEMMEIRMIWLNRSHRLRCSLRLHLWYLRSCPRSRTGSVLHSLST